MPIFAGQIDGKRIRINRSTRCVARIIRFVLIISYGHSCASLLINAGFNLKDIQEWMGHSDIKMTANIYGHLDVGRKQSMAEKLSGSLLAQR